MAIKKEIEMKQLKYIFIILLCGTTVHAQLLNDLVDTALKANPEIQAFEAKHSRISEKINEANTLPNTQIGFGYFVSEPETRTGPQRFKISAKQMLPSFGTITARENYIGSLADIAYEDLVIAKRKLVASVSKSYYNLYALKEKQAVLEQNIALLKTYEKLALQSLEVGKASAVDVLRLQMKQNELDQLKQILALDYLAELTAFNTLLNRAHNTQIVFNTLLIMPSNKDEFNSKNLSVHPELLKYDKMYASIEQSELLNKKEKNPMLGFGLDYIAVTERPNMNFSDNGKDILMPMLNISIPIFNNKHKSKSKQNQLKQEEILAQKETRLNKLETLLDSAIKKSDAAIIKYNIQVKNLNQAKDAESILIKSYETGTIDFNDVLAIQELQLKFQMNQISSLTTYYVQRTIINYLTE